MQIPVNVDSFPEFIQVSILYHAGVEQAFGEIVVAWVFGVGPIHAGMLLAITCTICLDARAVLQM